MKDANKKVEDRYKNPTRVFCDEAATREDAKDDVKSTRCHATEEDESAPDWAKTTFILRVAQHTFRHRKEGGQLRVEKTRAGGEGGGGERRGDNKELVFDAKRKQACSMKREREGKKRKKKKRMLVLVHLLV